MTQHYLLPCSCGKTVRVANAQAGGQVTCGCGNSLAVPTLRAMRELQFAPNEAQVSKPGWSPLHGVVFVSGILIATIGLALLAYSLFWHVRLTALSVDRSHDVVKFESANIDKLTAEEMIGAWTELLEEGLGEKQKPIWIAAQEKRGEFKNWMIVGSGTLALGAVLAVAALFVRRPTA